MFDYLMQKEYKYVDIYQPPCVRKAMYDYMCENDDFTLWLDQHYTLVDKVTWSHKIVKLSKMCSNYKETFLRLGSREYKKMTHDRFLEKLKENIKWRDVVNERYDDHSKKKWFVGV